MVSRRKRSRRSVRRSENLLTERRSSRRGRRRSWHRYLLVVGTTAVIAAVGFGGSFLFRAYLDSRAVVRYEQALVDFSAGDYQQSVRTLEEVLTVDGNNLQALVLVGRSYLRLGYSEQAEQALRRAQLLGARPIDVQLPLTEVYFQQRKFQQLIEEFPANSRDRRLRGRLLIMHGRASLELRQYAAAQNAFARAAELLPAEQDPVSGQALVALRHERIDAAKQLAEQAEKIAPDDPQVWFVKGEIARAREDTDQAVAAYTSAIERDAGFVAARVARAQIHIERNQNEAAVDDLKAVLAVHDDDPRAGYLYALALIRLGEHEQARIVMEASSSNLLRYSTEFVMRHPASLLLMGVSRFREGSFDQAAPLLHRFVEFEPENFAARKLLASVQLVLNFPTPALKALLPKQLPEEFADAGDAQRLALMAQAFTQTGQPGEAAKLLWQALSTAENDKPDYLQQSLIELAVGGVTPAEVRFRDRLDLDPLFDRTTLMLRVLRQRNLQREETLRTVRLLSQDQSEHASVANFHGAVALSLGELEESRMALGRALAIAPELAAAVRNFARVSLASGDLQAADSHLQARLKAEPQDIQAMAIMARLEVRRQQYETAIGWLQRIIELEPDALDQQLELVELYLQLQRIGDAQSLISTLHSRYPQSESVSRVRGLVYRTSADLEPAGALSSNGGARSATTR